MITRKKDPKILTKDISCEFKCRFDGKNIIQINHATTINGNMSVENVMYAEKIIFGILLHVLVKMENN